MRKFLKNRWLPLFILLMLILFFSISVWHSVSFSLSTTGILLSLSFTILLNNQKHQKSYQQAECTHEKMIRNLSLDIIGLLLTMGTAMYVGRLAGGYFGLHAGFWIGLLAGFLGGFAAAWGVRSVWGRWVITSP
jgi:hypothetical protein